MAVAEACGKAARARRTPKHHPRPTPPTPPQIEDRPFAAGAMRECFRMKKLSTFAGRPRLDWRTPASNFVAKAYKKAGVGPGAYFDDVRLQMDAKLWVPGVGRRGRGACTHTRSRGGRPCPPPTCARLL